MVFRSSTRCIRVFDFHKMLSHIEIQACSAAAEEKRLCKGLDWLKFQII